MVGKTHVAALKSRVRQVLIHCGYHSRPRFLVLGAQKAGTTALFYYLAEHAEIVPSRDKEIGFFTPEAFEHLPDHPHYSVLCPRSGPIFSNPAAYARASAWYHGLFPLPYKLGHRLTFEATPEYLYFEAAPERIFHYDRNLKLIVLLRDPVERAFSAWNMYHNFDDPVYCRIRDDRTFEQAIEAELTDIASGSLAPGPHYVRRGIYWEQLERYFHLFDREQILWIDSRRLDTETAFVLEEVTDFLGLPRFDDHRTRQRMHVGTYASPPPPATVRALRAFYAPHNRRLYELLNHDFGWL